MRRGHAWLITTRREPRLGVSPFLKDTEQHSWTESSNRQHEAWRSQPQGESEKEAKEGEKKKGKEGYSFYSHRPEQLDSKASLVDGSTLQLCPHLKPASQVRPIIVSHQPSITFQGAAVEASIIRNPGWPRPGLRHRPLPLKLAQTCVHYLFLSL